MLVAGRARWCCLPGSEGCRQARAQSRRLSCENDESVAEGRVPTQRLYPVFARRGKAGNLPQAWYAEIERRHLDLIAAEGKLIIRGPATGIPGPGCPLWSPVRVVVDLAEETDCRVVAPRPLRPAWATSALATRTTKWTS